MAIPGEVIVRSTPCYSGTPWQRFTVRPVLLVCWRVDNNSISVITYDSVKIRVRSNTIPMMRFFDHVILQEHDQVILLPPREAKPSTGEAQGHQRLFFMRNHLYNIPAY